MKKITLLLTLIYVLSPILFYAQTEPAHRCATMAGLEDRTQTDAAYAAFRQASMNVPSSNAQAIPCDGTNSVVIPVAFHFDNSFSCVDPTCLLTKVQEQIDALNVAFGDNSAVQQNIDLAAACPTGYPLADVSTGTCIEFKLAVPPAGQGLDPACDPAITIGQFGGGINTGLGGAPAWTGYLNIFVVEAVAVYGFPFPGIIGVADGIPGMASGDGVTILADAFGGVGPGCNSGNDLDIGATDGANFFFTEGGTTAHEIGHYLGLYHIWGDDQPIFGGTPPFCTGDDSTMPQVGPFMVNDTPLQSEATPTNAPCPTIAGATCASLPATCDGSNDYFHNYMDYSNDICMSMFTDDQSMVMNYWANQLFGGSTIPTFDSAPAVLTTLCEMQPCNVQVVCPVATGIDTPADACSTDGTQTVCVTFDIDPTGLVDLSINGGTAVIDPVAMTACVDVALPVNQTCNVVPLDIVLSATCTDDGSNVLDAAGADINGLIGTIDIFPEPLSVVTSGDGMCTTLMAELLAVDGTQCGVRTMACDADGSSLVYNFNADVTFAPPANCALMGLTGSIACAGCVACPVATSIDTPVDACSTDGTQTICLTFNTDPTGLVDLSINGDPQVPLIDPVALTACIDVTLPVNQTCDVVPLDFVLSATCTDDDSNILDADGVAINGSIGAIDVFPEPLAVVTSGDGMCNTLMAELLSADGTQCAMRTMACDADGSSLVYNFNADVTFAPPAECALMGLTGSIACDNCVPNCTAVAGTLTTNDNLTVCALDGNADVINVSTTGEAGMNFGWLITDSGGTILSGTAETGSAGVVNIGGTTFSPDLEGAPPGACSIWLISWDGTLSGADMGDNANGIMSDICFQLSNPITVNRVEVTAGTIATTSATTVCALDGNADIIDVTLSGQSGTNFGWLITDGATGDILSMGVMAPGSTTFSPDLEGAPVGTCQIWAISWEGNLSGANQGDNAGGISSDVCFELSNPIDVVREDCSMPMATITDPCSCTAGIDLDGDGVSDLAQETITITDPNGAGQGWALTSAGGLVDPDGMGGTVPSTATVTDNGDGTYTLVAYVPADSATTYTAGFTNAVGATLTQSGGPCTSCEFIDEVPTLGEWGLIILALLMTIVAIVGIRAREIQEAKA